MKITCIKANEVYSDRGTVGIQVCVKSESGAMGQAVCSKDLSIGRYERPLPLDGGTRLNGQGLRKAASCVDQAAHLLIGTDIQDQYLCDSIIRSLNWDKTGVIGATALSEAILKAAAHERKASLFRCIRESDTYRLPVPTYTAAMGSTRYGDCFSAGGKPLYLFVSYGFSSFSDAVYGLWETVTTFTAQLSSVLGFKVEMDTESMIPKNFLQSDEQILELMHHAILHSGHEHRIGIAIDIGADHFYHPETNCYQSLLEASPFTRDTLIARLLSFTRHYPVILLQDPLQADDFDGSAILTQNSPASIIGNELFVSQLDRLTYGLEKHACDGLSISPAHVGTISETLHIADYASQKGLLLSIYGTHGEDIDIADYAVGFGCDILMGCGLSFLCNRLLEIEQELGPHGSFVGQAILKASNRHVKAGKN